MAALEPGRRLGSYEVQQLLGKGGMAEVYHATHVNLERPAALKLLNPSLNADPSFPLRFLREAKTSASLNHPNIVTVYDFGEEGELAYLVMELAHGGTLRDQARKFTSLNDAVEALAAVGAALQYAHERGIVHRDVKPINVLVGPDDRLLLADFGLARIANESLDVTRSEAGAVFGTPRYMAPEQALGLEADFRADLYSLGIMAYELITGKLPYTGKTPLAVMQQHIGAPPPSLRAALPDAPAELDAVIRRATAKQPAERFGSANEFVAAVRAAAGPTAVMPVGAAAAEALDSERAALFTPAPWMSQAAAAATPAPSAADQASAAADDANADTAATAVLGAGGTLIALDGSGPPTGLQRRRPTSFGQLQWLTLGLAGVLVIFINGAGLWLTRAGRTTAKGAFGQNLTTYIYDHLGAFKSSLTAIAVLFALLAVLSMRAAIVNPHQISLRTYRLLRLYHRFVGYCAITIALAIGFLTCIGIFGFGTSSPRAVLHSILGLALLIVIGAKLAIVRYYPSQRRHLRLLGESILVLFLLVAATSAVPYAWSKMTGGKQVGSPYGRSTGAAPVVQVHAGGE